MQDVAHNSKDILKQRRHGAALAIVGIGCRFPGGVGTHSSFLAMLRDGRQAIGDIPVDRIDLKQYYDPTLRMPGKTSARHGGYLPDIDQFDAEFFSLSPREVERMDPQQRLLLETSWEAFEDAGLDPTRLRGGKVGVFVGQWVSDFEQRLFQHPEELDFPMTLGSGRYALSGRISYLLGFTGPSMTIDTACSSSLVAVHLASQSLRSGETDVAIAGGVNVILGPHIHVAYSQGGMMAPDGQCKFGDARADGYVRSEGAGIVALKRLEDALRDGDRIHAVIRGSAVNNDGASSGSMGRPSVDGQRAAIEAALADAGVDPLDIGYVEAHGTGTPAGDRVEIGALGATLGKGRSRHAPLLIGSVKTNIGHTESAAGVAGLIKATLAVREGEIAASLNFETPSRLVDWDAAAVEIARDASVWAEPTAPRRAGVNGFGISGTNAHVIIEEAPAPALSVVKPGTAVPILPLSARSEGALRVLAGKVADLLAAPDAPELSDVLRFAQTRRAAVEHRAAFLAANVIELVDALRAYSNGGEALANGVVDPRCNTKVALIFPCQGGQWVGMARSLIASEPGIRVALERADAIIRREVGWSLMEKLCDESAASDWADTIDVIQPALAALSIAYAEWLRDRGVPVDAVVGHSMGEASAAHFSGALSLEDALRIICRRSVLMKEKSGQGAMALVDLPIGEVNAALVGLESRVSVAAANSPRACIISGDAEPVARLVETFVARGVFSRLVKVDVASHSPHMEGPARTLLGILEGLAPAASGIPFVSSLLGRDASGLELDAAYWARNLREPVRFADALQVLSDQGISAFVELGPHPALTPSVEQAVEPRDGREPVIACCGHRDEPERASLLTVVAKLWCAGVPIDWAKDSRTPARVVDFPLYPWQRRRHWAEAAELVRGRGGSSRRGPDEHMRSWMHRVVWREFSPGEGKGTPGQPWLVLGEASDLADALASAGEQVRHAPFRELEAQLSGLGAHRGVLNVLIAAPEGEAAPFLPVRVAQAVMQAAAVRLWFVTRGAQNVVGAGRLDINLAALWGAARVLSNERPDIFGGLLDLPGRDEDSADLALAARLLLDSRHEDQIAVRGKRAFVPRLVREEELSGSSLEWRPDGAYLLTGGFGDVGLAVARAMVDDGARRLILAGRSDLPPRRTWPALDPASRVGRRVAAIRALESKGAAIHCWTVDVADQDAVKSLLDGYEAEGWPPIRGVVHLAAVIERGLMGDMKRAAFDASLLSKLRSAQVLDRLLPDLDCFVLFSSLSALLPQPGLVAYTAANVGLHALAENRRAQGKAAACIAWGTWHGSGLMAGESAAITDESMEREGIGSLTSEQGAALFAWAAGRADPFLAVLPIDWAAFTKARAGRAEPFLSQVKGAAGQGAVAAQLADATGPARRAIFAQIIAETVAHTLRFPLADVDHGREFGTMGMTSLLAMEMRNRLERTLGMPLSATLAWNYPTVAALSAHLAGEESTGERGAEFAAPKPATFVATAPEVADELAAVAKLSDDDALIRLRQRRAGKVS